MIKQSFGLLPLIGWSSIGGVMLYIVEVPISTEPKRLIDEMSQMRTWLDHMHYQPIAFRQVAAAPTCRVDFTDEAQARVFAKAFSGQLLRSADLGTNHPI